MKLETLESVAKAFDRHGVRFIRFPRFETLVAMKRKAGRSKDLIDVEYLYKARDA